MSLGLPFAACVVEAGFGAGGRRGNRSHTVLWEAVDRCLLNFQSLPPNQISQLHQTEDCKIPSAAFDVTSSSSKGGFYEIAEDVLMGRERIMETDIVNFTRIKHLYKSSRCRSLIFPSIDNFKLINKDDEVLANLIADFDYAFLFADQANRVFARYSRGLVEQPVVILRDAAIKNKNNLQKWLKSRTV